MAHYVNFGLPTHTKNFVTVALQNECPAELHEPLRRATQKYVSELVDSFLFGKHDVRTVRENFLKVMGNLRVAGVELARRPIVERDERNALCHNVFHYDFVIVEGDKTQRRTLMHAAYESFALKTISEFAAANRGEVVDMFLHEQLFHRLRDDARYLRPIGWYDTRRPQPLEILRGSVYRENDKYPRIAFRRVLMGFEYHFFAPTHDFQIYISNDFRELKMETCRAEGIDEWLPKSLHPVLN